jgi:hypothetical protein
MKLDSNQTPQDTISSKNGEINQELFLFLARRKKVEENMISFDWGYNRPFKRIEYSFNGFPGYGFNSFLNKKQMESRIIEMLIEETKFVGEWFYESTRVKNPERQKFIKTIREFLKFLLK